MNSFRFGRPVDICGEVFYITNTVEKIKEGFNESLKGLENVADENEAEDNCRRAIDAALGDGSFDKIFNGDNEKFSINGACQLISFLTDEIRQWTAEMNKAGRKEPAK